MSDRSKLSRDRLRKLKVGETAHESGIAFTRLAGGDGRWAVNVMVSRVRHHVVVGLESQGFTRTQADEVVAKLKASARERAHGVRKARAVTFKQAATLYLEHLRETGGKDIDKKAERLRLHLVPGLGALTLGTITESDLLRYSTKRTAQGASPATVNRELAVVSHLFRMAASRHALNLVPAVPCEIDRMREPEQPPTYLKPAEAASLIDAARDDANPHILAFVMVGLHTGMRRDPITRIRVRDIDFDRRIIWVDRDKAGERQQPMTSELAAFLRAYTAHASSPDGWLFPSTRGADGHAVNVYKAFRRVVAAAGLEIGRAHV